MSGEASHQAFGLDMVLCYYQFVAERDSVTFQLKETYEKPVNKQRDFLLTSIMGNLLSNAFEALEELYPNQGLLKSRPAVECDIEIDGSSVMIRVYNDCPEAHRLTLDQDKLLADGFTTKEGEGHGHGLAIVKHILDHKDGVMTLNVARGVEWIIEFDF